MNPYNQAACRDKDPDIFFEADIHAYARKIAKKVCGSCSIRQHCLDDNVAVPYGVYGGLTWHERRMYSEKVLNQPISKFVQFFDSALPSYDLGAATIATKKANRELQETK